MTAEPTYEYAVAWVRPDTGEEATAPMKSEAEALQEAQRLNSWMSIYRPVRRLVTPWEDVPDGECLNPNCEDGEVTTWRTDKSYRVEPCFDCPTRGSRPMTVKPSFEYAVAWVRPDTGEEGRVVCESKRQARRWASGLNWWSGQNGGPKYRIQRGRIVWEDVPDGD